MTDRFILRGHTPEPCADLLEWARWYEAADRHVAESLIFESAAESGELKESDAKYRVSTVFLGLDHNFHRLLKMGVDKDEPPILFETMVFERNTEKKNPITGRISKWVMADDCPMDRYATWEEAEAGHKRIVEEMKMKVTH